MKLIKKFQYNSPVVLSFALISFIVLLLSMATGGFTNHALFSVYRSSMVNPLFYFRLFGHVLGHENFNHYFSNMMIFMLIGPMLEEKYGSKNIIIMIGFTAFITGIITIIFMPTVALLGASGIVFMFILLGSFVNFEKGRIPLTLIFCVIFYLGNEVVAGFIAKDNIAHFAHIIGGSCGAGFGFLLNNYFRTNRK